MRLSEEHMEDQKSKLKVSLIIPTNNFLERLPKELEKLNFEVLVNDCTEDCDFLIGMSISVIGQFGRFHYLYPNVSAILYNWDWYSHLDKTGRGMAGDWGEFIRMMEECKEVWSASKITAEKCQKDTGIVSPFWNYAFIIPEEWTEINHDSQYIIQASRQDPQKRFDWFEKAAKENGIVSKSYHPNTNSRPDFIQAVSNCSFLCVCSIDESLGGLTAAEAAFCRKPVLVADFEGAKEVWGDDVWYFNKDSYDDLKVKMKWLWDNRNSQEVADKKERAYSRCREIFMPEGFALRIHNRLLEIK